ncbi:inosine-5-monophosphate dehydrogenase [Candidatus Bathyarchaeota archaeon]|nr:MAG: inosine-5-monophosphate dehydrogenase [Candidatus Bathyarchaeota archaeon]
MLLVRDVMVSPVITVREDDTIDKVAEIMDKHGVGSVIVASSNGEPVGVITARDIVRKVVARGLEPSRVKAADVMSSPIIEIGADEDVREAARKMARFDVRRLIVKHKSKMVGIVTSKDLLSILPSLIDVVLEKCRAGLVAPAEEEREEVPIAGYCDICGRWSDTLMEVDGQFLCEECRAELGRGE